MAALQDPLNQFFIQLSGGMKHRKPGMGLGLQRCLRSARCWAGQSGSWAALTVSANRSATVNLSERCLHGLLPRHSPCQPAA